MKVKDMRMIVCLATKSCDEAHAQDDVWRELAPTLAPAAKKGYNVSAVGLRPDGLRQVAHHVRP